MKVLIINGSPNKDGCTSEALKVVEKVLNEEGIETINIHIGNKDIRGCIDCGYCIKNHKCAFDDIVNETTKLFEEVDGLLIGSPVYYSGCNGTLIAFLDRLFNSSYIKKSMKVGAAVVSSRRAGSTSSLDEIYKYFEVTNMPIVPSTYWSEIHGEKKEEIYKDKEGIETLINLGRNMTFMIKSFKLGKEKYGLPKYETKEITNFIK